MKRDRPLDFAAVTDHSENMGVFNELDDPNSAFSKSEVGQTVRKEGSKGFWNIVKLFTSGKDLPGFDQKPVEEAAWQKEIAAANANYQPGKFTTFIAYEWSSMPEGKYNLHRNVIFKATMRRCRSRRSTRDGRKICGATSRTHARTASKRSRFRTTATPATA